MFFIIIDPQSFESNFKTHLAIFDKFLTENRLKKRLAWADSPQELTQLAKIAHAQKDFQILVIGNDQSLHHVIKGLNLKKAQVALIPIQDPNLLANKYNIEHHKEKILAMLQNQKETQIPLAQVNGEYLFFNSLEIGWQKIKKKKCRGFFCFLQEKFPSLPNPLKAEYLKFKPTHIALSLDKTKIKAPFSLLSLIINNSVWTQKKPFLLDQQKPGEFTGLIFSQMNHNHYQKKTNPELISLQTSHLSLLHTSKLKVSISSDTPVFLDGVKYFLPTPFQVKLAPHPLRLILPS